jgi:nucleoside phosphorylase
VLPVRRIAVCTALLALILTGCGGKPGCDSIRGRSGPNCVDIAILTVIPAEYFALIGKLRVDRVAPPCPHCVNRYGWVYAELDSPRHAKPYRIVIGMAGEAGTTAGALAAQHALARFRPRHLLLVGVAGGLPDRLRQGDVVLSESIWAYDYGAVDERFRPRQDFTFRADPQLLAAAIAVPEGWQEDIESEAPDPSRIPALRSGQIGSGNKVIEFIGSRFADSVLEANSQIVGVEMEGAGAAAAVEEAHIEGHQVGFLMIRGISDVPQDIGVLRDKKDRERWKRYAADAAASYTLRLIRDQWPDPPR